jgi:hypothetical protein
MDPDVTNRETSPDTKSADQNGSAGDQLQTPRTVPEFRLQAVSKEKNEWKSQAELEKQRADDLQAKLDGISSNGSNNSESVPNPNDFDEDSAYNRALIAFEAKKQAQLLFKQQQQQAELEKQRILEEEQNKKFTMARNNFEAQLGGYIQKNPTAEQDIRNIPEMKFSDDVSQTIVSLQGKDKDGNALSAKMYHHLFKNPQLANELNNLDPRQAALKIGQISSQLASKGVDFSNAPTPPGQIPSGSGTPGVDLSNLSGNDFLAAYDKATGH